MTESLDIIAGCRAGGASLPVAEGLELIRRAASPGTGALAPLGPTAVALMERVAGGEHYPEYVPAVVSAFSNLNVPAKEVALRLLADIGTLESLLAFLYLLKEFSRIGREPERPIIRSLVQNPKYPDVLFPAILELTASDSLSASVAELCLAYSRQGLLRISAILPYAPQLLSSYGAVRNRLRAQWAAGEAGSEAYQRLRQQAAVYLDLFGYLPTAVVRTALVETQECPDVWLKLRAILSAVQLGLPVNPEAMDAVAANPETGPVLTEGLERIAKLKKGRR